ncbi:MAG TPA: hypothetical protein DEA47_06215 [Peptococcaceae bacterium]|nr:MAG: Diguanylate cyclase (GGDEF) domain-containing protein [Clostridia bacterium 41_269]HBT20934.1 hypothetical protein [Peptococcaceae bacterium]
MKRENRDGKRQDHIFFTIIMLIWLAVLVLVFAESYTINFIQFFMSGVLVVAMIFSYIYGILHGLIFALVVIFIYGSYLLYGTLVTGEIVELRLDLVMWLIALPLGSYMAGQLSHYVSFLFLQSGEYWELKEIVTLDELTGFLNKKGFFEALVREMERARRFKDPLSLVVIKISNLPEMRAIYGEKGINSILKALSEKIDSIIRSIDIKGILEPDIIGIILPGTNIEGAQVVAKKLRDAVEVIEVAIRVDLKEKQQLLRLKVTIGTAEFSEELNDPYVFYYKAYEGAEKDVG